MRLVAARLLEQVDMLLIRLLELLRQLLEAVRLVQLPEPGRLAALGPPFWLITVRPFRPLLPAPAKLA